MKQVQGRMGLSLAEDDEALARDYEAIVARVRARAAPAGPHPASAVVPRSSARR